jgi:hypothetical protein
VEVSLGIAVLLGQAEVDNVNLVSTLADTHEEVVRLDITMDKGLGMDVFDAGDQLIRQQKDGLQGELPVAEVEEILQTGSEQIENHRVVVTLGSEPTNERDADTSGEGFVDSGFILELGVLGLDGLELDGDLLSGDDVGAWMGELSTTIRRDTAWCCTHQGRYHRNYRFQSSFRFGTCCQPANPASS